MMHVNLIDKRDIENDETIGKSGIKLYLVDDEYHYIFFEKNKKVSTFSFLNLVDALKFVDQQLVDSAMLKELVNDAQLNDIYESGMSVR